MSSKDNKSLDPIADIFAGGAKPWERMSGESATAFACFCIYRDQDPVGRSKQPVIKHFIEEKEADPEQAESVISEMAQKYTWYPRAVAWDDQMDRVARAEKLNRYENMTKSHVAIARMMQTVIVEALQDVDPGSLSPKELAQWASMAAKMEKDAIEAHTKYEEKKADIDGDVEVIDMVAEIAKNDPEAQKKLLEIRDEIASEDG